MSQRWNRTHLVQVLKTVGMYALVIGLALLPQLAFAQEGNPFANAEAQSGAIGFLQAMRFWVWIAFALGCLFFVIAYMTQGLIPDLYNTVRGWIRNAILIMLAFNLVFEFILAQATAAQGGQ